MLNQSINQLTSYTTLIFAKLNGDIKFRLGRLKWALNTGGL